MLDEHVDIAVARSGFQAVKDVAEILTEIVLNERAEFEFQRGEQVDFHKITCNLRLGKKLSEYGIVWCGGVFFFFIGAGYETGCRYVNTARKTPKHLAKKVVHPFSGQKLPTEGGQFGDRKLLYV